VIAWLKTATVEDKRRIACALAQAIQEVRVAASPAETKNIIDAHRDDRERAVTEGGPLSAEEIARVVTSKRPLSIEEIERIVARAKPERCRAQHQLEGTR
jgi:hypothetical protein